MKGKKDIPAIYKPFNFSSLKMHIIELIISETGVTRIEAKLPEYIKTLKGIYITNRARVDERVIGYINLSFNEGAFKNFQLTVLNYKMVKDHSRPIPMNTEIKNGSRIKGFFFGTSSFKAPYTLKIYLHYV